MSRHLYRVANSWTSAYLVGLAWVATSVLYLVVTT